MPAWKLSQIFKKNFPKFFRIAFLQNTANVSDKVNIFVATSTLLVPKILIIHKLGCLTVSFQRILQLSLLLFIGNLCLIFQLPLFIEPHHPFIRFSKKFPPFVKFPEMYHPPPVYQNPPLIYMAPKVIFLVRFQVSLFFPLEIS